MSMVTRLLAGLACLLALSGPAFDLAANSDRDPIVQAVSGPIVHGQSVTITGSRFGTKPQAAPLVWDDASGSSLTPTWDGAWPSRGESAHVTQYRAAPYRDVPAPHARTNRYIVGAHGDDAGYDAGYNVALWKRRTVTLPAVTYLSYRYRVDPKWDCGADNNHKLYDWSMGRSPYGDRHWYAEYNPSDFCGPSPAWHLNDNGSGLGGESNWWGDTACNPRRQWCHHEFEILHATSGGLVRISDNGKVVLEVSNIRTDGLAGTERVDGVGGYSRNSGRPTNVRYYADVYLDSSLARVVLANHAKYRSSTIRELQIPSAWSASSITVRANLGALASPGKAWLFVISHDGFTSQGLPVALGGS
jgi:hypothetical protein